jgi:hypothetical protein
MLGGYSEGRGMTRPAGRIKSCQAGDARARLDDARRFLAAADREVEPGNGDVVASLAILSAIAAADVLCCLALGERSNDGNHAAAIKLLVARRTDEFADGTDAGGQQASGAG